MKRVIQILWTSICLGSIFSNMFVYGAGTDPEVEEAGAAETSAGAKPLGFPLQDPLSSQDGGLRPSVLYLIDAVKGYHRQEAHRNRKLAADAEDLKRDFERKMQEKTAKIQELEAVIETQYSEMKDVVRDLERRHSQTKAYFFCQMAIQEAKLKAQFEAEVACLQASAATAALEAEAAQEELGKFQALLDQAVSQLSSTAELQSQLDQAKERIAWLEQELVESRKGDKACE